jgi:membrane associated rhomboid family serine protease
VIPLPIGDDNPTSRRPIANWSIILANGAVFAALNIARGQGFAALSHEDAASFGLTAADPAPARFLTSMFVHADAMHLLGNMWFLHIFGDNVEDKLGRAAYLVTYLLFGFAAAAAYLLFGETFASALERVSPDRVAAWRQIPLIGASGAIAGVTGVYMVFFPRARIRCLFWFLWVTVFHLPALVVIGMYLLKDLLLSVAVNTQLVGGVAYAAHVGGTLAGVALALAVKPALRRHAGGGWDRDTGFAAGPAAPGAPAAAPASWEPPRVVPTGDLRDGLVGAVLDGRMDLAVGLYAEWNSRPRREVLPPGVELEIAHEFFRRGEVEAALDAYRRYLGSHPRTPDAAEAKFRMGLLHARATGDRALAREWLVQAAAEHPDPATAEVAREELRRLDG